MWQMIVPLSLLYIFGLFNLIGLGKNVIYQHIGFLFFGCLIVFFIRKIKLTLLKVNTPFIYIATTMLLLFTYFFGSIVNGARRWIDLQFTTIQPSEIFKVVLFLFFSNLLSRQIRYIKKFSFFAQCILFFSIPTILIILQPDLSTGVVLCVAFFSITFISEIPKKYLIMLIGLVFFTISFIIFLIIKAPESSFFIPQHQRERILTYFNADKDHSKQETAYHINQAIITIGSGQVIGKGMGLGKQSLLSFLPEHHTDFAISALIEQFGFLGGFFVIVLYFSIAFLFIVLLMRPKDMREQNDRFVFFYTFSMFVTFLFQIFVNIGMNFGLLPVAGIPLPFISYGGSAMISWIIAFGILIHITSQKKDSYKKNL